MFAKTIIDSDAFLDMSLSAQALYFHLSMRADDEGFINNPKKIARMIGAADDDLKVLCAKNFLIPFESGVVVIKHWRIHNYIRADRLQPTAYIDERTLLDVKDNGAYTRCQSDVRQVSDRCQSLDGQTPDICQQSGSIDKIRLDKNRLDEIRLGENRGEAMTDTRHVCGIYSNVLLTPEDVSNLRDKFPDDWEIRVDRLSSYMKSTGRSYDDHYATLLNWSYRDGRKDGRKEQGSNIFLNIAESEGLI